MHDLIIGPSGQPLEVGLVNFSITGEEAKDQRGEAASSGPHSKFRVEGKLMERAPL